MSEFVPTTKADLDDKRWLDRQINALGDGIDAMADIWANWSEGRNVSRFADGQSYGDFIRDKVGFALPVAEVLALMPGASTREIAKVAGVGKSTVNRAKKAGVPSGTPDPESKVTGADGKSYAATISTPEVIVTPATREEPIEPLPYAVPTIAGIPTPKPAAPAKPSPEAAAAIALIEQVARLDIHTVINTMTVAQHDRLRKAAKRAAKVCTTLSAPLIHL